MGLAFACLSQHLDVRTCRDVCTVDLDAVVDQDVERTAFAGLDGWKALLFTAHVTAFIFGLRYLLEPMLAIFKCVVCTWYFVYKCLPHALDSQECVSRPIGCHDTWQARREDAVHTKKKSHSHRESLFEATGPCRFNVPSPVFGGVRLPIGSHISQEGRRIREGRGKRG